jgi:hypothetical protein
VLRDLQHRMEVLGEVVAGELILDVRRHVVLLGEDPEHRRARVEDDREGLARRADAHIHEILRALFVDNWDAIHLCESLRMCRRVHYLGATEHVELSLGRLVELERRKRVVRDGHVALVERRDADDGLTACIGLQHAWDERRLDHVKRARLSNATWGFLSNRIKEDYSKALKGLIKGARACWISGTCAHNDYSDGHSLLVLDIRFWFLGHKLASASYAFANRV